MGLALLFLGLSLLVASIAARSVSEWWPKCPHGVHGGQTQNRCEKCIHEQKLIEQSIEENLRLEEQKEARKQAFILVAKSLCESEWRRLASSLVPSLDELRRLSWQQFEDEIANMFRRMGYSVEQTPYTNDGGRDAILTKNGVKYLLECKKYSEGGQSGRPDLQKFHSAIITDQAKSGFFVTAGGFTKEAVEWAATAPMELIFGEKLIKLMFDSKPAASDDDSYYSVCTTCGEIVFHRVREPRDVTCFVGHVVQPTLTLEQLLANELSLANKSNTRKSRRKGRY